MQDRQRPHDLPHVRTLEQQTLDALLRIEELLSNLNEALAGPRGPVVPLETVIENITPAETPLTKTLEKTNTKGRKGAGVTRL